VSAPTGIVEVDALLGELRTELEAALGEQLVGIYLFGSLALGGFDPRSSDVDVLVAVGHELPEGERAAVARVHDGLDTRGHELECSYIPVAALRRHEPEAERHLSVGADWELGPHEHGPEWVLERRVLRDAGGVVLGPPPAELIAPVADAELRDAARALLLGFWRGEGVSPAFLATRRYQAFAVLSVCRALFTIEHGEPVTKPAAAAWASEALEPRWRSLVERALRWRDDRSPDDPSETIAFIDDAVRRADRQTP
jgi:predicted nucleotidyltransferase